MLNLHAGSNPDGPTLDVLSGPAANESKPKLRPVQSTVVGRRPGSFASMPRPQDSFSRAVGISHRLVLLIAALVLWCGFSVPVWADELMLTRFDVSSIRPGEGLLLPLAIESTVGGRFNLSASSSEGWEVDAPQTVDLLAKQKKFVSFRVSVPAFSPAGLTHRLKVVLRDSVSSLPLQETEFQTLIAEETRVGSASFGDELILATGLAETVPVRLTNSGNTTTDLALRIENSTPSVTIRLPVDRVVLAPRETRVLRVNVRFPSVGADVAVFRVSASKQGQVLFTKGYRVSLQRNPSRDAGRTLATQISLSSQYAKQAGQESNNNYLSIFSAGPLSDHVQSRLFLLSNDFQTKGSRRAELSGVEPAPLEAELFLESKHLEFAVGTRLVGIEGLPISSRQFEGARLGYRPVENLTIGILGGKVEDQSSTGTYLNWDNKAGGRLYVLSMQELGRTLNSAGAAWAFAIGSKTTFIPQYLFSEGGFLGDYSRYDHSVNLRLSDGANFSWRGLHEMARERERYFNQLRMSHHFLGGLVNYGAIYGKTDRRKDSELFLQQQFSGIFNSSNSASVRYVDRLGLKGAQYELSSSIQLDKLSVYLLALYTQNRENSVSAIPEEQLPDPPLPRPETAFFQQDNSSNYFVQLRQEIAANNDVQFAGSRSLDVFGQVSEQYYLQLDQYFNGRSIGDLAYIRLGTNSIKSRDSELSTDDPYAELGLRKTWLKNFSTETSVRATNSDTFGRRDLLVFNVLEWRPDVRVPETVEQVFGGRRTAQVVFAFCLPKPEATGCDSSAKTIDGIEVELAGRVAASNESGVVLFRNVEPGTQRFKIRANTLPADLQPTSMEFTVSALSNGTHRVEVPLRKEYFVKIAAYEDRNSNSQLDELERLVAGQRLEAIPLDDTGVPVEMETSSSSSKALGPLRPGRYKLKLIPSDTTMRFSVKEWELELPKDAGRLVEAPFSWERNSEAQSSARSGFVVEIGQTYISKDSGAFSFSIQAGTQELGSYQLLLGDCVIASQSKLNTMRVERNIQLRKCKDFSKLTSGYFTLTLLMKDRFEVETKRVIRLWRE